MAGRPSSYTEEKAAAICDRLIEGESLRQICADKGMPNRSTVLRWMADNDQFASRCARARLLQADLMDDLIMDEARGCTTENAQAVKVRIAAYQWRASKLDPKKYGDKLDLNHSGSIQTSTDEQIESRLTQLLGKAGASGASGGKGEEEETA